MADNLEHTQGGNNVVEDTGDGRITGQEQEIIDVVNDAVENGDIKVIANPTLTGKEDFLTGLQVGDTKYIVGGGSSGEEGIVLDLRALNLQSNYTHTFSDRDVDFIDELKNLFEIGGNSRVYPKASFLSPINILFKFNSQDPEYRVTLPVCAFGGQDNYRGFLKGEATFGGDIKVSIYYVCEESKGDLITIPDSCHVEVSMIEVEPL